MAKKSKATHDAAEKNASEAQDELLETSTKGMGEALGFTSREEFEQQLNALEEKSNANEQALLRAQAELDNVRRRAEAEQARVRKYATEKLILEFLPIVDSLEQGLAGDVGDNTHAKNMQEGMQLTLNMMLSALNKFSVTQLDPLGEAFNPAVHEAMSTREEEGVDADTVLQVFQKGYLLEDRLIRPALVVVAK